MTVFIIAFIIVFLLLIYNYKVCPKGGLHKWEYKGLWGVSMQQKRCSKCGKLKLEDQ